MQYFCPSCLNRLIFELSEQKFYCSDKEGCGLSYPEINEKPILLLPDSPFLLFDEPIDKSVVSSSRVKRSPRKSNNILRFIFNLVYGNTFKTKQNIDLIVSLLNPNPKVLVVGGASRGDNTSRLWQYQDITVLDVYDSQNVDIIGDAHYLPFPNNYFDLVFCQAVLEHVLDPIHVSGELSRVLRTGGLLYVEAPFMQQVHEGRYDFFRFSLSSLVCLFRQCIPIRYGSLRSSALSAAWSMRHLAKDIFYLPKPLERIIAIPIFLFFSIINVLFRLDHRSDRLGAGSSANFYLGQKTSETRTFRYYINTFF